jgi:peptidoglycan pentaglycine glycine transferase (the first glycine)
LTWSARLIGGEERERFNAFVTRHPRGHILQSSEWGEVKARTGWQPLHLVVETQKEIVASVLLLKRQVPVIRKCILYAPRGPVLTVQDQPLYNYLLAEIRKVARKERAILLKIDPDILVTDQELVSYLEHQGFRSAELKEGFGGTQPKFVFRLDISPSLETLFAAFHPKTRYNIRLAGRKGVTVTVAERKHLPEFYEVLQETATRDRFLVRSYDYFEVLWDELVTRGYAQLFLAWYQEEIIAGTLAFILGDKAWYIYGASSNRHRNVMPNYQLQWTMINWAKEHNCTLYDFRGVAGEIDENHPLFGLYRFKKGFNATYTEFIGEYDLVYDPVSYRLWQAIVPFYSNTAKKLVRLRKKIKTSLPG